MIPKLIHYCWFGKNSLPEPALQCIESWKRHCPDFTIIEWSESNYNVEAIPYTQEAYKLGKYAFVSDYARFDILNRYGGVYLDVDVEVLRDITSLCAKGNWMGMESPGKINPGLGIGTCKQHPILEEIMSLYEKSPYALVDGAIPWTVVDAASSIFKNYGLKDEDMYQTLADFNIYPTEFLCPKNVSTGTINITENTYAIHHYDASWIEDWQRKTIAFKRKTINKFGNNFFTQLIVQGHHAVAAVQELGFGKGARYCLQKRKKIQLKNNPPVTIIERPMNKILFVSNTANFAKFNLPYMDWCIKQGWHVDYCSTNDEQISGCHNHYTIPIPRSPFSPKIVAAVHQLRELIGNEHYNIIHCHTPTGGGVCRLAIKGLRKETVPYIIYTAHGFHFYKGAPHVNWLFYYVAELYLSKFTNTIITINTEDYTIAKKTFAKHSNIMYMPGIGINLEKFSSADHESQQTIRCQLGFSEDDFIITVVGELNKNKNQIFLINTIPTLKKHIPTLKVVFLGLETRQEARQLAKKLKLDDVCLFLGYRKDVDLFQKITNVCFSASIREGLPANIMEGMACGKPVVCSKNRGHKELINHGCNGLLFSLDKEEEMIQALLCIHNNPELAKKLGFQAKRDAAQYDVKKAVDFISKLYLSCRNGQYD